MGETKILGVETPTKEATISIINNKATVPIINKEATVPIINKEAAIQIIKMEDHPFNAMFATNMGIKVQITDTNVPGAGYPTIHKETADTRKTMKQLLRRTMTLKRNCFIHVSVLIKIHKMFEEKVNSQVKLGDGKLHNVEGFLVKFEDDCCEISDKKNNTLVAKIKMTTNQVFPMLMTSKENFALEVEKIDGSLLWHLRYGHLNQRSQQLLHQKNMVVGLSSIHSEKEICEGYICGPTRTPSFNNKSNSKLLEKIRVVTI
ncbi:unnamed protein product [Prunus armeniaca]